MTRTRKIVFAATLLLIPISVGMSLMHAPKMTVFVAAALAIIPLAGIMGRATDQLSRHVGAVWGGLLNATFGNATELIIGLFALHEGLIPLVRASIIGSILGNILLVLGGCAFAGGLRYRIQTFSEDLAQTHSINLLLATVAIAIPAIFARADMHGSIGVDALENLSVWVAVLLLLFYFASLWFSLKTHEDLFANEEGDHLAEPPQWSMKMGIAALAASSVFVALESNLLVDSVQEATRSAHMPAIFVGIIIIPIIGNAAEHSSAIFMAMKNRMDVAINIAIGSSIQVAMFVAPFLILASLLLGHRLSFVFTVPELTSVSVAVLIAAFISNDGKTHWLEGAQLIAAYIIIALGFYFLVR